MVNAPPVDVLHPTSEYQVTTPVESEAAVNACPPAEALTGLPRLSWSWTVITPAAAAHAPAVRVRGGVMKTSRPAGAGPMLNAALVAPVSGADAAVRV